MTPKIVDSQLAGNAYFLDVIGEANEDGAIIQNFREAVDVRLSDEEARELPMRQIAFETGLTLFSGKYSFKFRGLTTGTAAASKRIKWLL